jgi:uncharacterized membrane protein (UPF0127 family)
MRLRTAAACAIAVLLGACGAGTGQGVDTTQEPVPASTAPALDGVVMRFDDAAVTAEIVASPKDRQLGLMHREELAEDAGMLFVFPEPTEGAFWMKNTLIPLSIAYMSWGGDSTFEVLSIVDMEPCRKDPCPGYPAGAAFDAALEVNQGWFEEHGISEGATAQLEGDLPNPT